MFCFKFDPGIQVQNGHRKIPRTANVVLPHWSSKMYVVEKSLKHILLMAGTSIIALRTSVMILPSLNSPSPLNTSTSYRVEKKPFPIPTLTNMTIYVRVSLINSERHPNWGSTRFSNSVLRKCFVLKTCLPTTEERPSAGPSNPFHAQIAGVVPYACPCPV